MEGSVVNGKNAFLLLCIEGYSSLRRSESPISAPENFGLFARKYICIRSLGMVLRRNCHKICLRRCQTSCGFGGRSLDAHLLSRKEASG